MVNIKPGVKWSYAPGVFCILNALGSVSTALGVDITVTSAADGVHSGPADPHYTGNALDIRTHDLGDKKQAVLTGLLAELNAGGVARFTAFIENPGTANEHIHCQRKYGTNFTMGDYLAYKG